MTLLWILFLLALCAACVPVYLLGLMVGEERVRKERDATVDRLLGLGDSPGGGVS